VISCPPCDGSFDHATFTLRKPTEGSSTPSHPPDKNNLTIIVVGCIGGFLVLVSAILILVPFARRRALKRRPKDIKSSVSSSDSPSSAQSRREAHNRTISVDAFVPLLESEPNTGSAEYSRFGSATAQSHTITPPRAPRALNTDSLRFPRRFAPSFKSSSARPASPDLEPGLSRPFLSQPQPPLRHARTRIAHVPMDTLPEDSVTNGSPQRVPSPTATSADSHAPASTSWLHIPKASNIPLIGAFRGSLSSLASAGSSSLPTMQHYPSFTKNVQSASASTRSSQTFYSVVSDGPTAGPNNSTFVPTSPPPPLPSEQGEIRVPVSAASARLKPSDVGERMPQVHKSPSTGLHPSRQASMVYSQRSSVLSAAGGQRRGERDRPRSGTVTSGSSLSLYTDARSQLGAGEEGRQNGSVDDDSGGARSRRS
jgi:hypothetical protein